MYITSDEFIDRVDSEYLPLGDDQTPDKKKIRIALEEAEGILIARLPALLLENKKPKPLPAEYAVALKTALVDMTLYRLTNAVTGSEDLRDRYKDALKFISSLAGGVEQEREEGSGALVDPEDKTFFKKGNLQ